jgi:Xaa-Pro aminopeptidase
MAKSEWRGEEDVLTFSSHEIERRHKKIRELMQLRGIDCLIVSGHTGTYGAEAADIGYISGVSQFFQGGYILFPFVEDPVFFAASPVIAVRVREVSRIPVEAVVFRPGTRIRDYATSIIEKIKKMNLEKGTLGIVSMRVLPADAYAAIKRDLPYAQFVSAGDILLETRRIKSTEEMEFIRRSGQCADKGVEAIVEGAQPGVTEEELVAYCDMAMNKAGGPKGNFILLGSGPWDELTGTIGGGGQRRLEKGDLILNEITSCYGGYYTQLCVPISLGGDVPEDFMKLLAIHKTMHKTALEELRPGNWISEIEERVAKTAASGGEDFRRAWATQSTELAEAFFKLNTEVKAGMSYVNHPWTEWASGKGFQGHTIGNTCIVTDGEPEIVHKSPLELRIV